MIQLDRLAAEKETLKDSFRRAAPFPWLAVDDFLTPEAVDDLGSAFDVVMQRANKDPDAAKKHKHVLRKIGVHRPEQMEEVHRAFFREIASERFVSLISEITGIYPLYPDPELNGGGLHEIYPGGFLNVHTDFNFHPVTGKHRRLNILVYLNRGWQEDWHGALELWPEDNSKPAASILPLAGRMALFETSEVSFHGHPVPLACPEGVTRRSLAAYYYSDWPEGLARREKTNYRLTPSQYSTLQAEVTSLKEARLFPDDILTVLSARYQLGDIKRVLKELI